MKLIICTDTRLGYSFNERRQSSDRVVHQHMADLLLEYDAPVYMNNYSGRSISRNRQYLPQTFFDKLLHQDLKEDPPEVFLKKAGEDEGSFAFVENVSIEGFYHRIDEIFIYTWDKKYPADLLLPSSLFSAFILNKEETFRGRSHDEIIFRHYVRKSAGS